MKKRNEIIHFVLRVENLHAQRGVFLLKFLNVIHGAITLTAHALLIFPIFRNVKRFPGLGVATCNFDKRVFGHFAFPAGKRMNWNGESFHFRQKELSVFFRYLAAYGKANVIISNKTMRFKMSFHSGSLAKTRRLCYRVLTSNLANPNGRPASISFCFVLISCQINKAFAFGCHWANSVGRENVLIVFDNPCAAALILNRKPMLSSKGI